MSGPSEQWKQRMSQFDDSSCSVAGSLTSASVFDDQCDQCGIGFRLPSGRCDHCNAMVDAFKVSTYQPSE